MHNKEKYPEIWAAKEKIEAELAPLLEARAEHMAEMNVVQEKITALKAEKSACHEKACTNLARIRELQGQSARMANAMGAIKV